MKQKSPKATNKQTDEILQNWTLPKSVQRFWYVSTWKPIPLTEYKAIFEQPEVAGDVISGQKAKRLKLRPASR